MYFTYNSAELWVFHLLSQIYYKLQMPVIYMFLYICGWNFVCDISFMDIYFFMDILLSKVFSPILWYILEHKISECFRCLEFLIWFLCLIIMSKSEKEICTPEHKPVNGVFWSWATSQLSQERLPEGRSLAEPWGICVNGEKKGLHPKKWEGVGRVLATKIE